MALGASARDILSLILREGLAFAAAGVLIGAASATLAARWLASLLYGVGPFDPLSYTAAVLLLPASALLGCWRPAAANPAEIIREE